MTNPIIEVQSLIKDFPKVRAVNDISFTVKPGICFGMLGPNGAGKTTTVEIMEGIVPLTSGTILYKGNPINQKFKEEVGIQFQSTALQDWLSCREVLTMFSHLYKKAMPVNDLIKLCDLEEFADQDSKKLSGGQRQRMLFAIALVNNPELIFLDEPTTGLDPHARKNFWEIVREIKAQGKTLILTTHYMEEAQNLCDELIIMDHGKILTQGTPQALLSEYFKGVHFVFPRNDGLLQKIPSILNPIQQEETIEIKVNDISKTLKQLMDADIDLQDLNIHKPSLEDLFLHVTNKDRF